MKRIVIVGSSLASSKIIEEIRRKDQESIITLLAVEGFYPYDRSMFLSYLQGQLSIDDLQYGSVNFYEDMKVDVHLDKQITRFNFRRQKIFTEQKVQFNYDQLIITDYFNHYFPDIKGTNKDGVASIWKLKDVSLIAQRLPFIRTVAIESNTELGVKIAEICKTRNIDVLLIQPDCSSAEKQTDSDVSSQEENQNQSDLTEELSETTENNDSNTYNKLTGVRISEILGDAEVRAIKLDSGKILATDLVIYPEVSQDLRIYSDSALNVDGAISLDLLGRTSIQNVFAVDLAVGLLSDIALSGNYPESQILTEQAQKTVELMMESLEQFEIIEDEENISQDQVKVEVMASHFQLENGI